MTDRQPLSRPDDGPDYVLQASVGGQPAVGQPTGGVAVPDSPPGIDAAELTYDSGVELKARSQWAYARVRFFRHKLAVVSLFVLIAIGFVGVFAHQLAPHGYDELDLNNLNHGPELTGWHLFGTDQLGRDYLSRVIYGIRTSLWVALLVAFLSTFIGTTIGAIAGYYGGRTENLLMRFTDLILTLPGLAVLLTAAAFFGQQDLQLNLGFHTVVFPQAFVIGLILAFLFWTGLARIVRGLFLSLREKEFVEAAKAAGASDARIIMRHILPNCVGPIVVNMTLVIAAAILTEAALSFLGYGIQPPQAALGNLIADGRDEGFTLWWLVVFPGLVIVAIALCVNFVGDGLRDALDPTQRRVRA
jgi:peptide/nickel transport system permease protein